MSRLLRHTCFVLTLLASWSAGAPAATAANADSAKVAQLFVYASSGEVRFRDMVQPAIDSLIAMGERATPWLARKLDATDARERLTLANIFKGIGAPAVPYVVPYLDSAGEYMPKNAARCLGQIADTSATRYLIPQLGNVLYAVRSEVATALGQIKDTSAVDPLLGQLGRERDGDVRKSCIVALGKIGDPRAIPSLLQGLSDPFFGARQTAVIALGNIAPAATSAIVTFLHRAGGETRYNAIVALGMIDDPEAQAFLLNMVHSPDPMVRGFAIEGLTAHPDKTASTVIDEIAPMETDPFVLAQIARYRRTAD